MYYIDLSKLLGREGACRGVTQVLTLHLEIEEVVEEVCFAVGSLSSHEDAKNRELLGDAGVADLLVRAMGRHEKEEAVAEQACWAITCLAAEAERPSGTVLVGKLVQAGVCKILSKVLSRHHSCERVAELGCQAIVLLSSTANIAHVQKVCLVVRFFFV